MTFEKSEELKWQFLKLQRKNHQTLESEREKLMLGSGGNCPGLFRLLAGRLWQMRPSLAIAIVECNFKKCNDSVRDVWIFTFIYHGKIIASGKISVFSTHCRDLKAKIEVLFYVPGNFR